MKTNSTLEAALLSDGAAVLSHADLPDAETSWGAERSIAASVIREAVLDRERSGSKGPMHLCGVQINGHLALGGATLPESLTFERCRFDERIDLREAQGRALHFPGCYMADGIEATRLELSSFLDLNDGFASNAEVKLTSAHVRGLDLSGARLSAGSSTVSRTALNAERLLVDETMVCKGLTANGEVRLYDARIGLQLGFQGAQLENPDGYSLNAYGITVGSALLCNEGFRSRGGIWLLDAKISGQVSFRSAHLQNPGQNTISGSNLSIGGNLHIDNGFDADGTVLLSDCLIGRSLMAKDSAVKGGLYLTGSRVQGTVDFSGGKMHNPGGQALSLERATVGGSTHLRLGFEANGEINLASLNVRHQLSLSHSRLTNTGQALNANRATIEGSLYCDHASITGMVSLRGVMVGLESSFDGSQLANPKGVALTLENARLAGIRMRAESNIAGELNMQDSRIEGVLDFTELHLSNPGALALRGSRLTVKGSAFFSNKFKSEGSIVMRGAQIGSELSFAGATTNNTPGSVAIDLNRAQAGALRLTQKESPSGTVSLREFRTRVFEDNPHAWPERLILDGFSYESLAPALPTADRLRWLALAQPNDAYHPGLYDQLAALYRQRGREEKATDVAIAKERRRRPKLSRPARLWNRTLDITVGYGYKSHRALGSLVALIIVGFIVFSLSEPEHFHEADPSKDNPGLSPLAFSIDAVLPVVDLGQESSWIPSGAAELWYWTSILSGWLLTTVLLAALTGILKRTSR